MQELKNRLNKINHLKNDLDAIIVINDEKDTDYFYFTNSEAQGVFVYDFSKPHIFTNRMEFDRSKSSWVKNIEIKRFDDVISAWKGKTIGINFSKINTKTYIKLSKNFKLVDISDAFEKARYIKTQYEIKCIQKACEISKKSFKKTDIGSDRTEIHIAADIEREMKIHGCRPAFDTIVASGKNIQIPHHEPISTKAKRPLLIDFGARYNGYCADISRTIGSRLENIILKCIDKVEENLFLGAKASKLDEISRNALGKYNKFFITSLGHGIGLDVHEKPFISSKSSDVLKNGMIFTIEPGIYIKNGIRIENDYLITKNGFKKFTKF